MNPYFTTERGDAVHGISPDTHEKLLSQLVEEFRILPAQISEAASYSLAMVVRFALGLSAQEGQVCALINQSLSSAVALSCLRHLVNAGCDGVVLILGSEQENASHSNAQVAHELQILEHMGVGHVYWESPDQNDGVADVLRNCHNAICGWYTPDNSEQSSLESSATDLLNELSTPIHCISAPRGINVETGKREGNPLFASSTLALGVPFKGFPKALDYLGRLYVCDVSFPRALLEAHKINLPTLFSEQPVVRLVPPAPTEDE